MVYPHLSRMALDYLSIPGMCSLNMSCVLDLTTPTATSVDVEHIFSKGRLLLSHVRNGLSAQSTQVLMCLGAWSRAGLVKDSNVMEAVRLPDVSGSEAELNSEQDDIL